MPIADPAPRILVAEDEFIIGCDLCDTVAEAGFVVEGPHETVESAMRAAAYQAPDLAILDIRLGGGEVFPLAEQLMAQDVPVIFHSGQVTVDEVHERFPDALACAKPCPPAQMIALIDEALQAH
ncbi:response regulator [Qipengyuania sp. YIM B01966]|uniref:response regulator n=1 Tax=Qipengyuania sp. YIM B01966 TaxID=2778646 RepID=UPI00351C878A